MSVLLTNVYIPWNTHIKPPFEQHLYTISGNYLLLSNDVPLGSYYFNNQAYIVMKLIRVKQGDYLDVNFEWNGVDSNKRVIAEVGRYKYRHHIIDVIFNIPSCDDKTKDWLTEDSDNWSYDLQYAAIGTVCMHFINKIPHGSRTASNIKREFMARWSSCNNKKALIEGNWNKDISDGKDPRWCFRSKDIFESYIRKRKPYKYGQCWTFAETLVSVLRYIGIPSRTIRINNCYMDKGNDGGVDLGLEHNKSDNNVSTYEYLSSLLYVNKSDFQGSPKIEPYIPTENDFVWNTHVITECWNGFEWECLDPCASAKTRHDPHRGKRLLGPCPRRNVKECYGSYDGRTLHTYFNAPIRIWNSALYENINVPFITKIIHENRTTVFLEGDDITHLYKNTTNKPDMLNSCLLSFRKKGIVRRRLEVKWNTVPLNNKVYIVQVVVVRSNNVKWCTRFTTSIQEDIPKIDLPFIHDYISVLIICPEEKRFWCTII